MRQIGAGGLAAVSSPVERGLIACSSAPADAVGDGPGRMLRPLAAAMMLLTAGGAEPSRRPAALQYSQVIVREQIVVRIPARPRDAPDPAIRWKEKKGPKCVPARQVIAAALISPGSVDLILRDRSR